ncbi:diguanylate cyclase domain-containing protein [Rugamonas fusca]|uniref:diguanylate cyclase domain-containing protein n=1 Tax=Rugamonas fusca TaxID=2758568 RepID=UPI0015F49E71|nr:diguanylate cyclase [Rugamonas fusca]
MLGAWLVAVYCWWGVLAMGGQVSQARERKALLWQGLRAVFLGFGTWAFHFIGMLGWQPGVTLSFGARQTLLSLLVSMLAAWPLLGAMRRGATAGEAWPGVLAYCAGLSVMHYMGIYAADTVPGIRWAPGWIALSTLLALVLAICTLDMKRWINGAAPSERLGRRSLTALLLGSLLFAVHFTSVAGATYSAGTICVTPGSLGGEQLAILVAFATTIIFSSTMWFSVSDARLETQLQQQALALQTRSDILEQSLRKDGETDLPNRLALEQALQRAAGHESVMLTVFCIELEGYQVIADSWGQETATALARELAQRLRGELEAARILARTGDAQFIAVMTGDMPTTTLAQTASRIVAALRRPFGNEGLAVSLGCRIGVSTGSPAGGAVCAAGAGAQRRRVRDAGRPAVERLQGAHAK